MFVMYAGEYALVVFIIFMNLFISSWITIYMVYLLVILIWWLGDFGFDLQIQRAPTLVIITEHEY